MASRKYYTYYFEEAETKYRLVSYKGETVSYYKKDKFDRDRAYNASAVILMRCSDNLNCFMRLICRGRGGK